MGFFKKVFSGGISILGLSGSSPTFEKLNRAEQEVTHNLIESHDIKHELKDIKILARLDKKEFGLISKRTGQHMNVMHAVETLARTERKEAALGGGEVRLDGRDSLMLNTIGRDERIKLMHDSKALKDIKTKQKDEKIAKTILGKLEHMDSHKEPKIYGEIEKELNDLKAKIKRDEDIITRDESN